MTIHGPFESRSGGLSHHADSRYVFVGNQFTEFTAVDLTTRQTTSTINGNYRFGRVSIFEDAQRRILAVQSSPAGTGGQAAILLVDATDPSHMSVINQIAAGSGGSGSLQKRLAALRSDWSTADSL